MRSHVDYLIIGNSAAGITAAEGIRANDPQASLLMISREPHAAYGRPLISYMIEGKTSQDAIWLKDDGFYGRNRIDTLFGPEYEAVRIDPKAHVVSLRNDDSIEYGKCLLAMGSVPFIPPIEGLDAVKNAHAFLTLDDAKGAWEDALVATESAHAEGRSSRLVVIGAGLIGLKAAEALACHVDEVLVLELAPRILPAVLDDEGARMLQESLISHGVRCMPGVSAQSFSVDPDGTYRTVLTNGEEVPFDLLVTAVGVRPNSQLAVEAGAEQGRGLIVDERLRTTLPDIYAAGDVTQVHDILDGSDHPLALWPNAIRQGMEVARHMTDAEDAVRFVGSFAINAVDIFEASLLTAGLINPTADSGCEEIVVIEDDSYAKFITRDGLLVGYILLNRPDNAGIYTAMIENRIPLDTFSEDIFHTPPTNLSFPDEQRWERLHGLYPGNLDHRGWRESA